LLQFGAFTAHLLGMTRAATPRRHAATPTFNTSAPLPSSSQWCHSLSWIKQVTKYWRWHC